MCSWERPPLGSLRVETGLGFGDGGELGFPALLEAACHEAVLWFAQVEGTFGAGGVVAGAFDAQLERAQCPRLALVQFFGGGQGEGDLVRCHDLQ